MNNLRLMRSNTIILRFDSWTTDLNQGLERLFCHPWTLFTCKLLIGVVSAYDIYLTIKYVDSLSSYELNPIGRWLMGLDTGPNSCVIDVDCSIKELAAFITAKFAGNFIALSVIELLASWKRYLASSVALPIAFFQLVLLYFLVYGNS